MPDEVAEYTLGNAQAEVIKAIVDGSITAGLKPEQTAFLMGRLGRAILSIPEELRVQALSPELFFGVEKNLTPLS